MAIVKMEKLRLTFDSPHLDQVLSIMQGFQGIHLEDDYGAEISPQQRSEIEGSIRDVERALQNIHSAIGILDERQSTNLFGGLAAHEEAALTIGELERMVEQSNWREITDEVIRTDRQLNDSRSRRHEISSLLESLEIWESLSANPLDFSKLTRTTAQFGSVHAVHADEFVQELSELRDEGIYYEKITDHEERAYLLIVYHNRIKDRARMLLGKFSFTAERYPFDRPQMEMRRALEREDAELAQSEETIDAHIQDLTQHLDMMGCAEDYHLNLLLRKRKALEVGSADNVLRINGWIIADKSRQFEEMLQKQLPKDAFRITFNEVQPKDVDSVPILLRNGKISSAFERLTRMYSLPKYNELDPTPVMTVFYMLFYGMMVGDAGYGLAILLVTLFAKRFMKSKRGTKSFMDFLYYLSFPIIGWGLVFGNFCGMELPFHLLAITVDIIPMTILSIALGYAHIMTGLVMYMINRRKLGEHGDLLSSGLSWFLIFLGGGCMIVTQFVEQLQGGALFYAGAALLTAGLFLLVILPAILYKKRWYAGLGKGLYALYGAMNYLGDFISYTRLMALGVAGGSVALAFNAILAFLPPVIRFTLGIVLAVVLHALNIFLTMLSAYVHDIRLQFIEFFSKFYTGGGEGFEPFKAAEKNVIIVDTADKTVRMR